MIVRVVVIIALVGTALAIGIMAGLYELGRGLLSY